MMASGRTSFASSGPDLGVGIGEGQDQRPLRHGLDHLGLEHAGSREAEEDVGTLNDLAERAGRRRPGVLRLLLVHVLGAAFVDDALASR